MLLNVFLKERRIALDHAAAVARLEKQVEMLTAGLHENQRTA